MKTFLVKLFLWNRDGFLRCTRAFITAKKSVVFLFCFFCSKFIAMSGVVVGRRAPPVYGPGLVILVVHGTITWTLARDIVSAVTRNSAHPLEVSRGSSKCKLTLQRHFLNLLWKGKSIKCRKRVFLHLLAQVRESQTSLKSYLQAGISRRAK